MFSVWFTRATNIVNKDETMSHPELLSTCSQCELHTLNHGAQSFNPESKIGRDLCERPSSRCRHCVHHASCVLNLFWKIQADRTDLTELRFFNASFICNSLFASRCLPVPWIARLGSSSKPSRFRAIHTQKFSPRF